MVICIFNSLKHVVRFKNPALHRAKRLCASSLKLPHNSQRQAFVPLLQAVTMSKSFFM